MSWTKIDDLFTEKPEWDGVSYEARWHYLAMVQACSRARRWDGRLPLMRALRASDVAQADACIDELAVVGFVIREPDTVILPRIEEHIPPPYIRENAAKSRDRMQRMRAHRNGDHSRCLPEHCDWVTGAVTRNTGTGRDRTGRDGATSEQLATKSRSATENDHGGESL
jgi:hypothetical protein